MKKVKRWILGVLFVFLGMEVITLAPKRIGKPEEVKIEKVEKRVSPISTTSQIMRGVKLVETGATGKEWELEADYAQGYKEKGTWKMQGVTVRYYGTKNMVYKVTGDSGTIEIETKNMEVYGNVVMETSDGFVMKSQSLFFNSKTRELTTDDFINVTGPKSEGIFELTGRGFKADMKTNIMDLRQDVKALRAISLGKEMNIKSDHARITGINKKARFEKRVQVDIETIRMTGDVADFSYDQQTKALEELFMQGDVHVTDQLHFASSEKARVLFKKDEFILSGNPRVTQNDNELRGEEIHILNGGKSVQVRRARAKVDNEGNSAL